MRNLRGQQQSLVDNRPRRKRRNVEEILFLHVRLGHCSLGQLAYYVELAFEGILIHATAPTDEDLLDVGLRVARDPADHVAVNGRVAPSQDGETFFLRNPLEDAGAQHALLGVHRKKYHSYAVFARRRQSESNTRAFAGKERVWNLNQDAGAVASFRIAATRAAMGEVDQDLNALQHNVVRFLAINAGNKSRSEEHTSELQSHLNLVCRLLLEKKKTPRTAKSALGRVIPLDQRARPSRQYLSRFCYSSFLILCLFCVLRYSHTCLLRLCRPALD